MQASARAVRVRAASVNQLIREDLPRQAAPGNISALAHAVGPGDQVMNPWAWRIVAGFQAVEERTW